METATLSEKTLNIFAKKKGLKQKDFISRLQTMGVDINPTSYSKLEGQVRYATDIELFAIAKILGVSIDSLFEKKHDKEEML